MRVDEVLAVLGALERAGCHVWVAGGWGVDALIGRQTREHRDLDLAIDAAGESAALSVLRARGYEIETDWRPVRVELAAEEARWVDLHPVTFDACGHGRQADVGGGWFDYRADAFAEGTIGGVRIGCLSAIQQRRFRTGYELRDADRHDLALLNLFGASW